MKLLHTSDWHLGKTLYGRKRHEEFKLFLNWLIKIITDEKIDALLISGDIFDNKTPNNTVLKLYYQFLKKICDSPCKDVVIIAGNHDSPSLLNAPKEILSFLNIHIVGSISESVEDEIFILKNRQDNPGLIVCAVPYLRDKDIRKSEAGESIEEKDKKLVQGIYNHYKKIYSAAKTIQTQQKTETPIVVMGHLFAAGSKTTDKDGVRELYIGSLGRVGADLFPDYIDYTALGHLHMPQKINKSDFIRYSGSPLPMSFGEAMQKKIVITVNFENNIADVNEITVPCFQKLKTIKGNQDTILSEIETLKQKNESIWLEIVYESLELIGDLQTKLSSLIKDTKIEILRIKNSAIAEKTLSRITVNETLDDLSVKDVFTRCLDTSNIIETQRKELIHAFDEIVSQLNQVDKSK